MKTQSSGNAARPRRQIPLRRSQFETSGEVHSESSSGRGRFAQQNFASCGSIIETAALSYRVEGERRPFDSARVDSPSAENPAARGADPPSARQLEFIQNSAMKQRLTEKA